MDKILQEIEEVKQGRKDTLRIHNYRYDYSYFNVSGFPEIVYDLLNLRELIIEGIDLSDFPSGISKLEKLKKIEIRNCRISEFPKDFSKIKNLEVLKLEMLNLSHFTIKISELTRLRNLSLGHNKLKRIPDVLSTSKTLLILNLEDNAINNEIDWKLLPPSLKTLKLKDNGISELPVGIGYLGNLKILYLNQNKLTTLPSDIVNLSSLSALYLTTNKLEIFPLEILKIEGLTYLNVMGNLIQHLPLEITALPNLRSFKYKYNPIDKNSLFKKLTLAGVYQELQNQKREKFLVGLIKIREEFTSAFQKYFVGFDRFLRETKGLSVNIFSKKVPDGVEIEIELPEMKEELVDIVREAINDYFSLISPATIESPDKKILELSKENLLLKLELKNTVTNFKNEIEIERTRAEIMKLNAMEFRSLLEKSLSQPINLNLNNEIHQDIKQRQNLSLQYTINITKHRESFDHLYSYLLKKNVMDDSSAKLGKELQDYLDEQPDDVKEDELKSNNNFKNKLSRFISKTWNVMKTAKDVLKYPKDVLDALNTIIKLAVTIGVSLDPEIVKQITEFIAGVK